MKRLLALLALCLPIYLFAQGFGSFTHDQPYFAKDVASSQQTPIPLGDLYLWINPTTNYTFKSNLGTTNVTTTGDSIGAISNSVGGGYVLTNSQADGQANITWLTSNHGNTNPVINCNWSQTRLLTVAPVSLTNWTFVVTYLDSSGGFGGLQASPLGSSTDSNYFTKYVQGSQASFFQANGGGNVPFTIYENVWLLTTIYSEFSPSGATVKVWTNGVLEGTSAIIANCLLQGIKICANDTYRWRGDIAEVVIYGGAQTSNTVWQVQNYLRRHPFPYAGP